MTRHQRQGIVYNVNGYGTARIAFDKKRNKFEGVLETEDGSTMLLKGNSSDPSISSISTNIIMNVDVVDGEEGSVFHISDVLIKINENEVSIHSDEIEFNSDDKYIGMKAALEIQQHMSANITEHTDVLFVGNMKIRLLTSHKPNISSRRESISTDNADIRIIEETNDFLA